MFSVEDKYGKVKEHHPKTVYLLVLLLVLITGYKILKTEEAKKEAFEAIVEKNAISILYTDIAEENLEYYLNEPYCGYKIFGGAYDINTLNRKVKGAKILSREYISNDETIEVSICYSMDHISKNTQKDLLIIIILFITLIILLRRRFAHEKAEYYKEKIISDTQEG